MRLNILQCAFSLRELLLTDPSADKIDYLSIPNCFADSISDTGPIIDSGFSAFYYVNFLLVFKLSYPSPPPTHQLSFLLLLWLMPMLFLNLTAKYHPVLLWYLYLIFYLKVYKPLNTLPLIILPTGIHYYNLWRCQRHRWFGIPLFHFYLTLRNYVVLGLYIPGVI